MPGVLALDLATVAGWAWGRVPERVMSPLEAAQARPPAPLGGAHRISRAGASVGLFLSDAEDWLNELCDQHGPVGLIYEKPILDSFRTGFETALKLGSLAGLASMVACRRGIHVFEPVQPSTLKKHWTGSGKADKPAMIAACRTRGWEPVDDNHADALALWDYAGAVIAKERRGRRQAA